MYFIVLCRLAIVYLFVFLPFVNKVVFFEWNLMADTFVKSQQGNASKITDSCSAIPRVKISIFICRPCEKTKFAIECSVHKMHICGAIARSEQFLQCTKKLRNLQNRTPAPRASQIWCQNVRETLKEKSHKVSRRELLSALQSNLSRNVEGGAF